MKKTAQWLTLALLFCWSSIGQSGELAENLVGQISSKKPNELVKVWIKLPRVENAFRFKASVNAQATTRAERYQAAVNRLRQNNTEAQQALVQNLKGLEKNNLSANIKPHWITNILEAEVAVGELSRLANRNDVEMIYAVPKIELVTPDKSNRMPALSDTVTDNLKYIKADSAWQAGYTGAGRIICSFDTGVDGLHPALINNWKGRDGNTAAAWFDPKDQQSYPHIFPELYDPEIGSTLVNHGTNAMGLLVGHDDATGDTIGVALGAKWISAAVIDIHGTSIIDAFEWAVDPDGDPNSMDDVPDVISHSWGVKDIGCMNIFYDLIDNVEALGIVNIFAAGNEGPASTTIRNPANGADNSHDCFAVGNFNLNNDSIAFSSSRGPSDCNGAIKPNVCAPGSGVWTCFPDSNYWWFSGTSAATPHVAGLVALLRQKNPNATVDEIKEAILTSAIDYGTSGPDNDYGWGLIDCMAALNALSSTNVDPNVRVYAFDHNPISPGDTVVGTVVLQNIGADAFVISAFLTSSDPSLTVLNSSAYFGTINEGDTVRSSDTIKVVVSDTITVGSVLSLDLAISGSGGYSDTAKLYFVVEPASERLFATHNAGRVEFTVSNFGTYGLGVNSFFPVGGVGFSFDGGSNDLYELGLIIGTDADHVSDGVRNAIGEPDGDFNVLPGSNIELIEPGQVASQETFCRFSDERAENSLGFEIVQRSYSFNSVPNDDFIILRYIVKNSNPYTINGVYIGLYCDWDVINYASNAGGWETEDGFAWIAYNNGTTISNFRGVKVVDGITATAFTSTSSLICYLDPIYCPLGDGFTEQEKYSSLIDGFGTATTYMNARVDLLQLISAGPLTLGAGQFDTVAFALLAGNFLTDITVAAGAAQTAYDGLITDVKDETNNIFPTDFTLSQNYPNPFNPNTTVEYSLPVKSHVELTIYDVLGRKILTLVDKTQRAGSWNVLWDGKNDQGENVASGIYLYCLKAGESSKSRKMLLLK